MKEVLIVLAGFAGVVVLAVIVITRLTPRLDRWGATAAEVAANYPGDELVPAPASFVNRAITIQAARSRSIPGWCNWVPTRAGCTATLRSNASSAARWSTPTASIPNGRA